MNRRYYEVLGVPPDADEKTIKKAYRKLAGQHHPDRNQGNAQAEAKFKEINAAYDVLGDPTKRKLYDEFGEDAEKLGFDPEKARAYRQWRSDGNQGFESGIDLEDLLAQMFGGGGFGGSGFGGFGGQGFPGGGRAARPSRGRDLRADLSLDFTTAVLGGERTLQLDGRPVTVRLPAGVRDGGTLRLRGQGQPGPGGGPAGDLLLTLHVAADPHFERDGDDLRVEVPITLAEALRGATIEVPTIRGAVRVKVPAGAQGGQVLRVRGKGVHRPGHTAGDLLARLQVRLPDLRARPADEALDAAIDALEATYTTDVRAELRKRIGSV